MFGHRQNWFRRFGLAATSRMCPRRRRRDRYRRGARRRDASLRPLTSRRCSRGFNTRQKFNSHKSGVRKFLTREKYFVTREFYMGHFLCSSDIFCSQRVKNFNLNPRWIHNFCPDKIGRYGLHSSGVLIGIYSKPNWENLNRNFYASMSRHF